MKLTSKSIRSPGRTDKQISLSTSLSKRLRNNGGINGGQSPMFRTDTKKRGSGFENTEPTSPKVTCIGQVRVIKTKKKHAMKMRSMSNRRIDRNREGLKQRSQKWVHLPLTICEALRAFGACMSFSRGERKTEKTNMSVIGEEEKTECSYRRRHVMEDIDFSVIDEIGIEKEEGRMSLCVPPKNALLLMRCRSDPVKMADLSNRSWKSLDTENDDDEETEHENKVNFEDLNIYEKGDEEFNDSELVIMEVKKTTEIEGNVQEINQFQEEFADSQEEEKAMPAEFMSDSSTDNLVDREIEEDNKTGLIRQEEEEEENHQDKHEEDEESIAISPQSENGETLEIEAQSVTMVKAMEEAENSIMEKQNDKSKQELEKESRSTPLTEETLFCRTEITKLPNKVDKFDGGDKAKKLVGTVNRNSLLQPARSSCSYPVATAVHGVPITNEPFELTRCKSEPRRKSAKLAQPEACSWKNRKLEPHHGAAGIGV